MNASPAPFWRRYVLPLAFLFGIGRALANCKDSEEHSACSTGPDYPDDIVFPYVEDTAEYPHCKARCGTSKPSTLKALPSGSCSVDGERCLAWLNFYCGSQSELAARVDALRCTCESGSWVCVTTGEGGGWCGPYTDAGMHY